MSTIFKVGDRVRYTGVLNPGLRGHEGTVRTGPFMVNVTDLKVKVLWDDPRGPDGSYVVDENPCRICVESLTLIDHWVPTESVKQQPVFKDEPMV